MRDLCKALADENRRLLLDKLHARNGQHMTRQAVAKHLAMLEAANLVPVPIHEIAEGWIGERERHCLQALAAIRRGWHVEFPKVFRREKPSRVTFEIEPGSKVHAASAMAGPWCWPISRASSRPGGRWR